VKRNSTKYFHHRFIIRQIASNTSLVILMFIEIAYPVSYNERMGFNIQEAK